MILLYALLGLLIGSFLNVCIHRLPRRESVVFPRSHCPQCGNPIRPYDNIPIFSFLLLRGRCRLCKNRISFQYPLVELLSGLAFYGCGLEWRFAPATYVNSLFLSIIIILIFVDYHHQILPNILTLPGIALGILVSPLQSRTLFYDLLSLKTASILPVADSEAYLPWVSSILGAIVGGGILFMVGLAYEIARKKQGLGMGDVKMMAMVGAFVGWRLALMTVFAGSLLGSLAGIFLIIFRGKNMQSKLAFGTFLGVGSALSLFYGFPFLRWYLNSR